MIRNTSRSLDIHQLLIPGGMPGFPGDDLGIPSVARGSLVLLRLLVVVGSVGGVSGVSAISAISGISRISGSIERSHREGVPFPRVSVLDVDIGVILEASVVAESVCHAFIIMHHAS